MRLRSLLLVCAAALAGVTLLLAGREVARRFSAEADTWELLFAIFAVANAVVSLVVLDWVRNLDVGPDSGPQRRSEEQDREGRNGVAVSPAETRLVEAVRELERLANEERGAESTIDEAFKIVSRFSGAANADLWAVGDGGALEHQARHIDGETAFGEELAEPVDEAALAQAFTHHKPFEAVDEEGGRFLQPLVVVRRCVGVLKVFVPIEGDDDARHNAAQKLSSALGRLARHVAHAARAPELYDQALIDGLTGLYTHRHFVNRLTEATGTSRRYGEPLALVLLDIDNFGMINSRYGHGTADRAFQDIASLVQDNIREVDGGYRYGSDEVAIILPGTDMERAARLAERLRGAVRATRPLADEGVSIIVSISVGVAEFDEDMRGIGPLLAHAEEALYEAKRAGHDRVVRWSVELGKGGKDAEADAS